MNDKFLCEKCHRESGLYKQFDEQGKEKISCLNCNWETEFMPHHAELNLPTRQELKEEWH